MHGAFERRGIFIRVTAEAQGLWCRSDEFDARDVAIDSNFVAAQTSRRDRRMNRLALGLVFVAFQAFCGVDVFFEGNWMLFRPRRPPYQEECDDQQLQQTGEHAPEGCFHDVVYAAL